MVEEKEAKLYVAIHIYVGHKVCSKAVTATIRPDASDHYYSIVKVYLDGGECVVPSKRHSLIAMCQYTMA